MFRRAWQQRHHSHEGQDRFVVDFLQGLRGGYFLDSGAGDGLDGSNTLLLEREYAWTGVCVEPNPRFFANLERTRSCHCLPWCLFSHDGEADFLAGAREYGGILSAFETEHLARARHAAAALSRPDEPAVIRRRTATPSTLLKAVGAPAVIDYWSLDTEGSERDILESFPFDRHSVRVITVEHNYCNARREIRRLLDTRGYTRIATLGIDDVYVPTT